MRIDNLKHLYKNIYIKNVIAYKKNQLIYNVNISVSHELEQKIL